MPTKPSRETIFRDAALRMRADFEDARNNVPHRGEAGGEGEVIRRNFLNDHMPLRFRASNGFVIDREDKISGHTDVVLYDALNCPVYRTSERGMIIPNDNVAAVFEVKFQLTTTLLRSALQKIHELKRLKKTPFDPSRHQPGDQRATYGVIFAFDCDVKYQTVIDIWHKELTEITPLHNSCNLIVILDRGMFAACMEVPGHGPAPADIQGISPAPIGTRLGLTYLDYRKRTLDSMMRMLLGHLTFFRHRIDHPGFDFWTLGQSPVKWIGEYVADRRINYTQP